MFYLTIVNIILRHCHFKLARQYNDIVNELYSLFLKFSALGLLQDIRNNFHS